MLLSGGLDSTVNLYQAARESQVVMALTFDYGQRAASKEISSSQYFSQQLNIPHKVISLPWIKDFGTSSLIDFSREIPQGSQVSIDDPAQSLKTAAAVWVPNRNGIFTSFPTRTNIARVIITS